MCRLHHIDDDVLPGAGFLLFNVCQMCESIYYRDRARQRWLCFVGCPVRTIRMFGRGFNLFRYAGNWSSLVVVFSNWVFFWKLKLNFLDILSLELVLTFYWDLLLFFFISKGRSFFLVLVFNNWGFFFGNWRGIFLKFCRWN